MTRLKTEQESILKRKWFGTDGIRGAYGSEPMTQSFVYRCARAAAELFGGTNTAPLFVVGRDTRESGSALETALCRGLRDGGAQVRCIGVLPTAAVSMLTLNLKAAAGVMISASHNDFTDNGIKFFGPDGFKLADDEESQLERVIEKVTPPTESFPTGALDFEVVQEYLAIYQDVLLQSLPQDFSLRRRKIIVDASHGAAWRSTPVILRALGADVTEIASQPDGKNINFKCGSQHPELVQKELPRHPGAIGLCHDGDADRLLLIDEGGVALDGDELLAIAGLDALSREELRHKTLVATVMSNLGLDEAVQAAGGSVVRTAVGDRYVLEAMRNGEYNIGGEQSGHMLFLDYLQTGDGLLSALQVLRVMVQSGRTLQDLRRVIRKYPQKLYNLKVREKKPLEQLQRLQTVVKDVEQEMGDRGRVLLRYSGTENKIRLLLEKSETAGMEEQARRILSAIEDELGSG